MLPPPWVLCWHIRICRGTTCGRICIKLVLVKIFWWTFFCLLAVLQMNPLESKQKTLQQYFILRIIPPSDEKRKKHQKLSTVGSSSDLSVSSQGVNYVYAIIHRVHYVRIVWMINWKNICNPYTNYTATIICFTHQNWKQWCPSLSTCMKKNFSMHFRLPGRLMRPDHLYAGQNEGLWNWTVTLQDTGPG